MTISADMYPWSLQVEYLVRALLSNKYYLISLGYPRIVQKLESITLLSMLPGD